MSKYKVTVNVEGKTWATQERDEATLRYNISFTDDGDYYGGGYYMDVESENGIFKFSYDMRNEMSFHMGEEEAFIKKWVQRRWDGSGSYKLKAITIERQ